MNTTDAILKSLNESARRNRLFEIACQSLCEFTSGMVVSTEMKKVKIDLYLLNRGADRESKGVWIGAMQEVKYKLGLHVI